MNEIVRKSTAYIYATVYSDNLNKSLADLTDAAISCIFKDRYNLPDSSALYEKTLSSGIEVIDFDEAKIQCKLTDAETDIPSRTLYFEFIVTLASGDVLRSGVQKLLINPNVKHL